MRSTRGDAAAPPIWEHRMLGDGHTTALLRPDGEVDWWCAPEPDSPPVLWRLLDPDGGTARWCGATPVDGGSKEVAAMVTGDVTDDGADDVAGPALSTVVLVTGRRVELLDGLTVLDGCPALVRLARAVDEPVELVHELTVGGFERPPVRWVGATGDLGTEQVVVGGTGVSTIAGQRLRTMVAASTEAWSAVVITLGSDGAVLPATPLTIPAAEDLAAALDDRRCRVAESSRSCQLPRHHAELAVRALQVLDACTYEATGAVLAAPTTSLPELPGGDRQFDYRFTWLRDSALAVAVATLLGRADAAERYLEFLLGLGPVHLFEAPVFDVRGGEVPCEREVAGVAGWAGSRPVRVGNDAASQLQYDVLGTVVEAVAAHVDAGGRFSRRLRRLVRAVARQAAPPPPAPSNGIWEIRSPAWLVSADIGRWLALDRALILLRRRRPWARHRRWRTARDEAAARVLGAIRPDGGLPQVYDDGHHDASALLVVLFGMLDGDDPRAVALVDATIEALGDGPFLRRYSPEVDDGFSRCEAAFLPCSWWAVGALAVTGRYDEARCRADELVARVGALQSEEADPDAGIGLGNVPLVWSHMEAARAMLLLDANQPERQPGAGEAWKDAGSVSIGAETGS